MERENGLQVIKLSDAKFITKVDPCIRNGQPILLENVEETLDPQLEPVLAKDVFKSGGIDNIKIGGENIPYNKDFKFFITTKLANPHYLPEICIKVTLINFTVTPEGLEDQLLVEVVKCEQPELEQKSNELVVQLADFKRQLKVIEDKILKLVAEAGKDILQDDDLINVLDASKQTSTTIGERMEEAERISFDIARDRENYRGVAIRGSVLYFVVADLANINFMYQYSLDFFLRLFVLRLNNSKKSD
jgi:dynein heavy chain